MFQVLINGLKHFVSFDVRPKLQIVETFIKVTRRNASFNSSKSHLVLRILTALHAFTGLLPSGNRICPLVPCPSGIETYLNSIQL